VAAVLASASLILGGLSGVAASADAPMRITPGTHTYNCPFNFFTGYGFVSCGWLFAFAPRDAQSTLRSLMSEQADALAPRISALAAKHPESLAIYVALLQVKPDLCDASPDDADDGSAAKLSEVDQEKRAARLFFSWSRTSSQADWPKILHAQSVLGRLWRKDHNPIVGFLLEDTLNTLANSKDPSLKGVTDQSILDEMVKDIGGDAVYNKYIADRAGGFKGDPPDPALVQPSHRLELASVASDMRSRASGRGSLAVLKNGVYRAGPLPPYSPEQTAAMSYFKVWSHKLVLSYNAAAGPAQPE
jgi:hypothetical protein